MDKRLIQRGIVVDDIETWLRSSPVFLISSSWKCGVLTIRIWGQKWDDTTDQWWLVHDFYGGLLWRTDIGNITIPKRGSMFHYVSGPISCELKVVPQIGWSHFFLWNTLYTGWLIMDPRMPYQESKTVKRRYMGFFLKWWCINSWMVCNGKSY